MSNNPRLRGRGRCALPAFHARFPWIGGDLQTLRNTLHFAPPDLGRYRAERLHLPLRDGSGDILWALLNHPTEEHRKPVVVLIHGLTGSENSRNIIASTAYHLARGFPVLRVNLRNAGPSLGRCQHFYHAGRSADLRDVLAGVPLGLRTRGMFLIGVSLGGNLLLKCLAEREGLESVRGAASVCAPIDLRAAQRRIMEPRNALYHAHLLGCLKRDAAALYGDPATASVLRSIRSIYQFDDRIVAPRGGFDGAEDYYARCSAAPLLSTVLAPTLLLTAANDPWIPAHSYLERSWDERGPLTLAITPDGGHVGFHAKDSSVPWHNRAIGAFIDSLL